MSETEKVRADVTRSDSLRWEGINPYQELTRAVLHIAEQLAIRERPRRSSACAGADRPRCGFRNARRGISGVRK